jgi:hypothetical protein
MSDHDIHDVMSAEELAEDDRRVEFALDAADEARNTEAAAAKEVERDDPGQECFAELIDGSYTYCGCEDCEQREYDDAEHDVEEPW